MARTWEVGECIASRWKVEEIHHGGMGIVYIVRDLDQRKRLAAKTYREDVLDYAPGSPSLFRREATAWINLDSHENLVRAEFFEEVDRQPLLFLEYVDGQPLNRLIAKLKIEPHREKWNDGWLQDRGEQLGRLLVQFCAGMNHAYAKGVRLHGDIKPENCFVDGRGTLKITDFGLSRTFIAPPPHRHAKTPTPLMRNQADFATLTLFATREGVVAGTPPYMAPEQFDPQQRLDLRSDIYSFGVMLFELLTGSRPFHGSTWEDYAHQHQEKPPPSFVTGFESLDAIVLKCLSKSPNDRFQGFSELQSLLANHFFFDPFIGLTDGNLRIVESPESDSVLDDDGRYRKAESLARLGRFRESVVTLNELIMLNPKHGRAWLKKGLVLLEELDSKRAAYEAISRAAYLGIARARRLLEQDWAIKIDNPTSRPQAPPLATAPFDHVEARFNQERWAKCLGVPWTTTNSIDMRLVLIPPGEFVMGSKDSRSQPHCVRITTPFYAGVCQVTQSEYARVMGNNPSAFAAGGHAEKCVSLVRTDGFPVERVLWHEAKIFCRSLSAMLDELRLGRCYRLPTEAEWEYACRAGTITAFNVGNELLDYHANFAQSDRVRLLNTERIDCSVAEQATIGPTSVGSYEPNNFGLFDMHGNVAEWCEDWYDRNFYAEAPVENPQKDSLGRIPREDDHHVSRGGGWRDTTRYCQSSARGTPRYIGPDRNDWVGFRVVAVSPAWMPGFFRTEQVEV